MGLGALAHSLDNFVQILNEGRISYVGAATAYFSESILVFTSNLGIVVYDSVGEAGERRAGHAV